MCMYAQLQTCIWFWKSGLSIFSVFRKLLGIAIQKGLMFFCLFSVFGLGFFFPLKNLSPWTPTTTDIGSKFDYNLLKKKKMCNKINHKEKQKQSNKNKTKSHFWHEYFQEIMK